MANKIICPYPIFFEEDGRPVEGGHIYIGISGLNPISNPLTCYYDEAMTIPAAAKDIRISGGYIVYKGAPRNLYVPGDYSLLVQDKNGSTIYSSLVNTAENADLLLTLPRGMMARAMRVPPSYNMNAILESGFYSWTNGGTSNFPAGCAAADLYALQVEAAPDGTGIIYQRLVDFTTGPTTALYTFERQSVNAGAAWTAWFATNIPSGYGTGWATALAPVGSMTMYAGASVPSGWLLCDGQAVSRTTYSALFTAISTTWGVGDGSTTFNVPDMREASPYGVGTRASGVTAHDAATLGEFKDDQMQQITGEVTRLFGLTGASGAFTRISLPNVSSTGSSPMSNSDIAFDSANSPGARTGTTTRGKLLGVNFIIKY